MALKSLFQSLRRRWFKRDPGYVRLEGELGAYESEVRPYIEEINSKPETQRKYGNLIEPFDCLIKKTKCAHGDGKVEQGWNYLHAAERIEIYARAAADEYEQENNPNGRAVVEDCPGLAAIATTIYKEADALLEPWRKNAIKELLCKDDSDEISTNLTGFRVAQAHWILYEQYQRLHLKRRFLQSQFNILLAFAIGSASIFLILAAVAEVTQLSSPFETLTRQQRAEFDFVVYVILLGSLGASLFGMRSLQRDQPLSADTAQHITSFKVSLARSVIGAVAALVIYIFLHAELIDIPLNTLTAQLILAISFTAGYSERLVPYAVESIAGAAAGETNK